MGVSNLSSNLTRPGRAFFTANGNFNPPFTGTVYVTLINGADNLYKWNGKVRMHVPYQVTYGVPVSVTIGAGNGATEGETIFGTLSGNTGENNIDAQKIGSPLTPYGDAGTTGTKPSKPGAVLVEW